MTNLARWDPFNDMLKLSTLMDQLLANAFVPMERLGRTARLPIDVAENDEGYIVQAVVPGVDPNKLEIILDGQVLTIRGEWPQPQVPEGVTFHLRERGSGRFERSIQFPLPVEADKVQTHYENGILTLHLPKAEAVKPRRITVQAAPTRQLEASAQPAQERTV